MTPKAEFTAAAVTYNKTATTANGDRGKWSGWSVGWWLDVWMDGLRSSRDTERLHYTIDMLPRKAPHSLKAYFGRRRRRIIVVVWVYNVHTHMIALIFSRACAVFVLAGWLCEYSS